MLEQLDLLAHKYACAYSRLYSDEFNDAYVSSLLALGLFLKKNSLFCVYLELPTISDDAKKQALVKMIGFFRLSQAMNHLCVTLLHHRRIDLLGQIIKKIIKYYYDQRQQEVFTVTTSHSTGLIEQEHILLFIQGMMPGKKIAINFVVNASLICGIKIKSDTLLWERSIAKKLKDTQCMVLQQIACG